MSIITILSAAAIIIGGVIGLGVVVCAVYMAIRWHREDQAEARAAGTAAAAA